MLFGASLIILILVLGLQIIRRFGGLFDSILKDRSGFTRIAARINADIFKYIFLFSIALIFILLFYQSWQQYQLWSQNEVSKYLLPPHQSINYFIFYALARFFAPYLISLAIAILFLISAKILNKKYQERFFYPEEPYFGALAIFLVSHPGWLFYLVFVILFYLLIHILSFLTSYILHLKSYKSYILPQRISLYYLWIPAAIFVIIISKWIQTLPVWQLLKV